VNEIRQNKATKQWVIYAQLEKTPTVLSRTPQRKEKLTSLDKECPFCPGNEHMRSEIVMEMPKESKTPGRLG
jgi:UDPglucose--hexose-1-phosphate uridylyltransferase